MDGVMTIRLIEHRDAPQAAKLWCDGLQQTIDSAPSEEKRVSYEKFFSEWIEKECVEGGSVGANGEGLIDYYHHSHEGRDARMFVAVQEEVHVQGNSTYNGGNNDDDGGNDTKDKVIGMIGVKRGMDSKEFPQDEALEDYSIFSVWKMSVATTSRGKGVGKLLMSAVEEWVRKQPDARAIRLYTANPIAASFYTNKEVGFVVLEKTDHYGIYEKKLAS